MLQQTLTDALTRESEYVSESSEAIAERYETFTTLTIPTHENPRFDAKEWRDFITSCTRYEANGMRDIYEPELSPAEDTILAGIALYHGDGKSLHDAFTIQYENENGKEWLDSKVIQFVLEFGQRFVFAPLVATWVPAIYICDTDSYFERVNYDSSGYYHPTEHWIAIKYDSGDPESKYWSVEQDDPQPYESSVTLHELGHAVHYLFTAQTKGTESVDNSDRESATAKLRYKNIERTKWQETFCQTAKHGYFDLLDEKVSEIRLWKQKTTVEEYLAEAFVAYITAPRRLQQKQPQAYDAYQTVCTGF